MKVRNHLGAEDVDVKIKMLPEIVEYEVAGQIDCVEAWGERLFELYNSPRFDAKIQVLEVSEDGTSKILATRLRTLGL